MAQTDSDLQRLLSTGQASEALKKIDQLLSAKPGDPGLRLQRGTALSMLNRQTEAIGEFQKLIESHPDMPGPYNNLAVLYANQGDYEKARHSLELAMRTNPIYAAASQNLGDVYAHMAGQAYKKALSLDKSTTILPLKLATVPNLSEPGVDPRRPRAGTAVSAAPPPSTLAASPAPAPPPAAPPQPPAPLAKPPAGAPVATAKPDVVRSPIAQTESQAVEKALRSWALAWSQRDMPLYYAAYTSDFKGNAASREIWQQDRRNRIVSKKKITIGLSDIRIKVEGNRASVSFRQQYTSDALRVSSSKRLEMVKVAESEWRIARETTGQ
jgi:hypothetical protein